MATVEDLIGMGLPAELARRVGVTVKSGVAAAGNSAATATALPNEAKVWARVTSATGTSADGIKLPQALPGRECVIVAEGGAALEIWPSSGDAIDDGVADAAATIADNAVAIYRCVTAGTWNEAEV
jgi:hypothetical protein